MTISTPGTGGRGPQLAQQILGTVIFTVVVCAWVYCKLQKIDTGELLAFAVPVVGALFLVGSVDRANSTAEKAADAATQAAHQTNGMLEARVQTAVSKALAARDAARTRQAVGDVSDVVAQDDRPRVVQVAAADADTEDYAEH